MDRLQACCWSHAIGCEAAGLDQGGAAGFVNGYSVGRWWPPWARVHSSGIALSSALLAAGVAAAFSLLALGGFVALRAARRSSNSAFAWGEGHSRHARDGAQDTVARQLRDDDEAPLL
mmetsp:Transcript_2460/g.9593  ORF Transcript_2460/g.9593 Transcript_2460/m.9593 type:complete len:118 (-) Transcript_2460:65-418(-)